MEVSKNEMNNCEVCGADDLEFLDGEVTCRTCGTQCTTQKTEVVLDDTAHFRYLTKVGMTNQSVLDSTIREKAARPMPWKLSEAFQLIFFAQVKAIHSKLDLPKDYYMMAVQLWMRYLKATGEAFVSEEERRACKYPLGWGGMYDPAQGVEKLDPKLRQLRQRVYVPKKVPDLQRQHDLLDAERELREMEFYDEDNPLSEPSIPTGQTSDLSSVRSGVILPKQKLRPGSEAALYWRGWCGQEVDRWFLLEYNLAVCFLPLLYLRNNGRAFGLSDVLELCRRRVVPFQNARAVLPETFVIRDERMARCFGRIRAAPSRRRMVRVTRLLLDLLGVARLARFPLLQHVSRRAERLCLPPRVASLAGRVALRWLTDTRLAPWSADEPDFERSEQHNEVCPDMISTAFVLLLLFCCRGRNFSEAQRRQRAILLLREACGRQDLFLWSEWAPWLARARCLSKTVTSIGEAEGFLQLDRVGRLLEDFGSASEDEDKEYDEDDDDEEEDEEKDKLGLTKGRAIQPHNRPLLIQKSSYVKDLMAPFEDLIDASVKHEANLRLEENEADAEKDFREHLWCCPIAPEAVKALLPKGDVPSGSASPILFSQDEKLEEPQNEDVSLSQIKRLVNELPTEQSLQSSVIERLPPDPPGDFKEVVGLCGQSIFVKSADLWTTTKNIQLSLMRLAAKNSKARDPCLNVKMSFAPLRWRDMFLPS